MNQDKESDPKCEGWGWVLENYNKDHPPPIWLQLCNYEMGCIDTKSVLSLIKNWVKEHRRDLVWSVLFMSGA